MEEGVLRAMEKPKEKQIHLFYCMESEDLAHKVAEQSPLIHLQSISWRSFISLSVHFYSHFFSFIFDFQHYSLINLFSLLVLSVISTLYMAFLSSI